MNAKRYFFWDEPKQSVQGPGKLQVLAVLYKQGEIKADTPVCAEGSEDWFPLRKLPEFDMLGELAPEGARIVMPGEKTDQQIENNEERKEFFKKAVVALGIGLLAAFGLMVVAALDPNLAIILLWGCVLLMTLGAAMTLVNALDDGYLWAAGVAFVPFLDIAYAMMNPCVVNWVLLRYISYLMMLGIAAAVVLGEVLRQWQESGVTP